MHFAATVRVVEKAQAWRNPAGAAGQQGGSTDGNAAEDHRLTNQQAIHELRLSSNLPYPSGSRSRRIDRTVPTYRGRSNVNGSIEIREVRSSRVED